jgi:hypothetical protein
VDDRVHHNSRKDGAIDAKSCAGARKTALTTPKTWIAVLMLTRATVRNR